MKKKRNSLSVKRLLTYLRERAIYYTKVGKNVFSIPDLKTKIICNSDGTYSIEEKGTIIENRTGLSRVHEEIHCCSMI